MTKHTIALLLAIFCLSLSSASRCTSHEPCKQSLLTDEAIHEKTAEFLSGGPRVLRPAKDRLHDQSYHLNSVDTVNSTDGNISSSATNETTLPLVTNASLETSSQISSSTTPSSSSYPTSMASNFTLKGEIPGIGLIRVGRLQRKSHSSVSGTLEGASENCSAAFWKGSCTRLNLSHFCLQPNIKTSKATQIQTDP
jgi:hypothetical protein